MNVCHDQVLVDCWDCYLDFLLVEVAYLLRLLDCLLVEVDYLLHLVEVVYLLRLVVGYLLRLVEVVYLLHLVVGCLLEEDFHLVAVIQKQLQQGRAKIELSIQ